MPLAVIPRVAIVLQTRQSAPCLVYRTRERFWTNFDGTLTFSETKKFECTKSVSVRNLICLSVHEVYLLLPAP